MCGFVFALTRRRIADHSLHTAMESLRFRGPDSRRTIRAHFGNWHAAGGNTRLAIRDLSRSANLPMERDGVTLLFNGEIYNCDELLEAMPDRQRRRLETTSDAEILLEYYFLKGAAALDSLEGMFALVLIDRRIDEILVARDQMGIKPLFVAEDDGELYFGSQIAAVQALRGSNAVDTDYLRRHALVDPFVAHDGRTPFARLRHLEPGTCWRIKADGSIAKDSYYSIRDISIDDDIVSEASVESAVRTSITGHQVSDVPLGCALSGGFDSSLISVLSRACNPFCRKFFTVEVGGDAGTFSEDDRFAKIVYSRLASTDTEFIRVPIRDNWSIERIDQLIYGLGTPLYDLRIDVWNEMYKAARGNDIIVMLNGQGADELWYGYYPQIWSWFSTLYHTSGTPSDTTAWVLNAARSSAVWRFIAADTAAQLDTVADDIAQQVETASGEHDHRKKLSVFMASTVLRELLFYEDATSMANSVEVRVPFLSRPVVRLALSLSPPRHLGTRAIGKDFLKACFRSDLPIEIIERQKAPLPKPNLQAAGIAALCANNHEAISRSPLVREIYTPANIPDYRANGSSGFYGNAAEGLLQLLSVWRFGEVFRV